MKGYLAEFTSEKAWGEDGYLADKGMIPMPKEERKMFSENVASLKTMEMK
jgi:phosphate transport system substrate-binding protein